MSYVSKKAKRQDALKALKALQGKDLHSLAKKHGVTVVHKETGRINKGWAGHVIERCLGLDLNSSRAPNLGAWELKVIPLVYRTRYKRWGFKEPMAITMIDQHNIKTHPFSDSHLLTKTKSMIIVARTVGANALEPSYIHSVTEFRLKGSLLTAVKKDYDEIQRVVNKKGFDALSGGIGKYIQPRTKGTRRGSKPKPRAFYGRTCFLAELIDLEKEPG